MTTVAPATSAWTRDHISTLDNAQFPCIPLIDRGSRTPILSGFDLWDMWPIQRRDAQALHIDGWTLWLILSAETVPDPDHRHHFARIRLMTERDGVWRDHGNALPDGFSPGSREWAGSAVFDPEFNRITLYFTAAGFRGESTPSFAQRIFSTSADLVWADDAVSLKNWSAPVECLESDDHQYLLVGPHEGSPGFIKGFRDPAYFCDPLKNDEYLLFTGSLKQSSSRWNGCIGLAARHNDTEPWKLLPPLVSADGLNNELERPHLVFHRSLYYVFWSTQRRTFAPDVPNGPNGLYGMVSEQVSGPYRPINGSGLVAANPESAPFQAYSWWVMPDLSVYAFVDLLDVDNQTVQDDSAWRRAHFGGVPAPMLRIALDGDRARVA